MGVFLMYHELQRPGRPLCDDDPGYVRYVVTEDAFVRQLDHLRTHDLPGLTVSDALTRPTGVAITFDDGCESDLLIAAPALSDRRFGGTFYITTGFLGRRGYLDLAQLRVLADSGFEIGSHGATHRFLTDLPDDEIVKELSDSKKQLEDAIGRAVVHVSCPGGRCDRRVAKAARDIGYRSVATSRAGINASDADAFDLARLAIMRHTSLSEFDRICRSRRLPVQHVRGAILDFTKRTLGTRGYVGLRSLMLRGAKYSPLALLRSRGARG